MNQTASSRHSGWSAWTLIKLFLLVQLVSYCSDFLGYSLRSQQTAPDGNLRIYEFHSNQDGEQHAPYGTILTLTKAKWILNPNDGIVFFAGYCHPAINYRWIDNHTISVNCQTDDSQPRTYARFVRGIDVKLNSEISTR